jgi:hypothetical protein
MNLKAQQILETKESERQYHRIKSILAVRKGPRVKNLNSATYWLTLTKLSNISRHFICKMGSPTYSEVFKKHQR